MTEQELKDQCTPEFIKWMCEMAEGFEFLNIGNWAGYRFELHKPRDNDPNVYFPLLIHRAVEGWNKGCDPDYSIDLRNSWIDYGIGNDYSFSNYQSENLTQAECAMLHCMQKIFKEERK